jgi:hypothetical protein
MTVIRCGIQREAAVRVDPNRFTICSPLRERSHAFADPIHSHATSISIPRAIRNCMANRHRRHRYGAFERACAARHSSDRDCGGSDRGSCSSLRARNVCEAARQVTPAGRKARSCANTRPVRARQPPAGQGASRPSSCMSRTMRVRLTLSRCSIRSPVHTHTAISVLLPASPFAGVAPEYPCSGERRSAITRAPLRPEDESGVRAKC